MVRIRDGERCLRPAPLVEHPVKRRHEQMVADAVSACVFSHAYIMNVATIRCFAGRSIQVAEQRAIADGEQAMICVASGEDGSAVFVGVGKERVVERAK